MRSRPCGRMASRGCCRRSSRDRSSDTSGVRGRCCRANAPAILGLHLEGPYISPEEGARGAHRREDTAPASIDDFKRRQDVAGGRVRLVTIAPEVPGALALIEHLRDTGVRVAIGHTAATPEQVRDAIRAGATLSTHLGNGCAQMLPRHPELHLGTTRRRRAARVDHRGRPPPAARDREVDGPGEDTAPRGARHRRDCRGRASRRASTSSAAVTVRLDENGRVAVPGQPNLAGSALSMDRAVANTVQVRRRLARGRARDGVHTARGVPRRTSRQER